jgi:hypothetical protein
VFKDLREFKALWDLQQIQELQDLKEFPVCKVPWVPLDIRAYKGFKAFLVQQ